MSSAATVGFRACMKLVNVSGLTDNGAMSFSPFRLSARLRS